MINLHIDSENLQEFDIGLVAGKGLVSGAIKTSPPPDSDIYPALVTGSDWSHGMILLKDEGKLWWFEATENGIVRSPLMKYCVYNPRLFSKTALMRFRFVITTQQTAIMRKWFVKQRGRKYDFIGILGFLIKLILGLRQNPRHSHNRLFCTEYIAKGFQKAGLSLYPNKRPESVSPQDCFVCPRLKRIG